MRKLLTLLLLLISYISFSQELGDSYKEIFIKVNESNYGDPTYNIDENRKWISVYSELGWNNYGFPLDKDYCDIITFIPSGKDEASDMIEYFNNNYIVVNNNNWNQYSSKGDTIRITFKSVIINYPLAPEETLVFYFKKI